MQHFGLGHIGSDLLHAVADGSHAEHAPAFGVNVAHHIAHVVFGHGDGHGHDRFKDGGACLGDGLLHSQRGGNFKRLRGRVHRVIFAVYYGYLDIDHRVARNEAALERFAHAFFDAWNVLSGNHAADNLVLEDKGFFTSCRQWFDLQPYVAKLTVATALPFVASIGAGLFADGLAIGDAGIAYFEVYAIFSFDALDHDLDM